MSTPCALINKVLPFSCVDGPGSRLAIFFQGCNLRCQSCHNPYTIRTCNDCGHCVAACPSQALSLSGNKVAWRAASCEQCDACLTRCPRRSTPMARRYDVEQLLTETRRYAPFIHGLTASGGEATLQLPFLIAFFRAVKQAADLARLSCLVDSNGLLDEAGWEALSPWFDGAMIDLKAWDPARHKALTGRDNDRIKTSIRWLAARGKLAELRLLVIPGRSDHLEHAAALADFALSLGEPPPIRLNPFHAHGVRGAAAGWPAARERDIEALADALSRRGLNQIIRPALYL